MKKFIALVLIAAFASSCSHIPLDESKPVQFTHRFWEGAGYSQNGEFLDQSDAELKIRKVPAAAEKLDSAARWGWGALGMIGAGAVVSLTAPRDSSGSALGSGQYWIGLGIIAFGSLPFTLKAQSRMEEAGEIYNNQRFTMTPKSKTSFYLSPVKDGGMAGLQVSF
jgi:hypothetical protein